MLMEMPAQNVEQWLQILTAVEQFGRGRLSKETITMRLIKNPVSPGKLNLLVRNQTDTVCVCNEQPFTVFTEHVH